MNTKIAKLFIRWIWHITSILAYQSNIIPHEQLEELVELTNNLENCIKEQV